MIFERTILYSPYNPYSIYFRMAVSLNSIMTQRDRRRLTTQGSTLGLERKLDALLEIKGALYKKAAVVRS